MKPIKLSLKGLNSFEQVQEIDFEKLASRGLFGIFGPTGSGKSSILDAITIALYGAIAREGKNSLQNAVNVNGNSLAVSFEFQIDTGVKNRYKVTREVVKTPQGTMKTTVAKITQIHLEGEEIICEKQKEVNQKVIDIIGLNYDDFIRTVVLPQGKFSEFLKLDGKERNIMLERLFSLEEYGEELTQKLKRKQSKELEQKNLVEGELGAYKDITLEGIKEDKEKLKDLKIELEKSKIELRRLTEEFKVFDEIYKNQEILRLEIEKKEELALKKEEIKAIIQKIDILEKINKLQPQITAYQEIVEQGNQIYVKHKELQEKSITLKEAVQKSEEIFKAIDLKKENELPSKKEEKTKLEAMEEDYDNYMSLVQNLKYLERELEYNKMLLSQEEGILNTIEVDITRHKESILKNTTLLENNKVTPVQRKLLTEGKITKDKLDQLIKSIYEETNRKSEIVYEIEKENKDVEEKTTAIKIVKEDVKLLEEKITEIKKAIKPQEYLLEKNQELQELSTKKLNYEKNENEYLDIKNSLEAELNKKIEIEKELNEIQKKLDNLKSVQKKEQTNQLIASIRDGLNGDACPVCGNNSYDVEIVKSEDLKVFDDQSYIKEILDLEEKEKQIEGNLSQRELLILQAQEKLKINELKKAEYENDINQIKNLDIQKLELNFKKEREAAQRLEIDLDALEISLKKSSEIHTEINSIIEVKNATVNEKKKALLNIELNIKNADLGKTVLEKEFAQILEALGSDTLEQSEAAIEQKDDIVESCNNIIFDGNQKLEEITNKKEKLLENQSNLKEKTASMEGQFKEKTIMEKAQVDKLTKALGSVISPKFRIEKLNEEVKQIEASHESSKRKYNEISEVYNSTNMEFQKLDSTLVELINSAQSHRNRLIQEFKINNFWKYEELDNKEEKNLIKKEIQILEEHKISDLELANLKDQIDKYTLECNKNQGVIEILEKQLDGKSISKEFLEVEKLKLEEKTAIQEDIQNSVTSLDVKLKDKEEKYSRMSQLFEKQKEIEESLARLRDLQDLFKGKRFVEFMAVQQMKYVSLEATKRLEEITSGAYSIETDEKGSFLIRDNKNGGILREPSTLSGGETFVVSLALALALSAHIQLKGRAPLELFFLDEGFGTLDENLLDTVISSLERIHHDKLKIGLISHVEQIKQRIPVKLIVNPGKSGLGGSKVKIEFS